MSDKHFQGGIFNEITIGMMSYHKSELSINDHYSMAS